LARYFIFVGAALLALLFISDAYLPKPLEVAETAAPSDLSIIRIRSDRKLPDRVVFDTSIPTIMPAQLVAEAKVPSSAKVADASTGTRVRDAFAQLPSDIKASDLKTTVGLKTAELKKPDQPLPHKRKVAKKRVGPPTMLVAQQPQFGFLTTRIW
jgi:hypothetical protein